MPAILEYIPYCKRDGTSARDEAMHPWLAGHGYCAIRVDMRGERGVRRAPRRRVPPAGAGRRGRGDRLARGPDLVLGSDRHVRQELGRLQQPTGWRRAGRRPSRPSSPCARRTTATRTTSTPWAAASCWRTRAGRSPCSGTTPARPTRSLVGAGWRETWMRRLENNTPWILEWLCHQRRDAFWKHGSVCEDYAAIACPVFAVGGWLDPYTNPGVPADGAPRRAAQGAHRPVGTPVPAPGKAGAGDRFPRGEPAVVGSLAQGARGGRERGNEDGSGRGRVGSGSRDSGRADDPGVDARQRPARRDPGAGAGGLGGGGDVAESPGPGADVAPQPGRAG